MMRLNLLRFELHKLSGGWVALVFGMLFIAEVLLIILTIKPPVETPAEMQYKTYCERLKGPLTAEKEQFLKEEYEKVDVILDKQMEMNQAYMNDLIDKETFSDYNQKWVYANNAKEAFDKITATAEHIRNQQSLYDGLMAGEPLLTAAEKERFLELYEGQGKLEFVYDTEWNILLGQGEIQWDFIILLAFLIPYWSLDYTHRMRPLQRASATGERHLFIYKYGAALLFALLFAIMISAVELGVALIRLDLPQANISIRSLPAFGDLPLTWSLATYVTVQYGMRILAVLFAVTIMTAISRFCPQPLPLVCIYLLMTMIPLLLDTLLPNAVCLLCFATFWKNGSVWCGSIAFGDKVVIPGGYLSITFNILLMIGLYITVFIRRKNIYDTRL